MPAQTNLGIPYPVQRDSLLIAQHFANLAAAVDSLLSLPDEVSVAAGVGSISTAAGVYASLPSPVVATITNPHPTRAMLVHVHWGGWLKPDAVEGRFGIWGTGANAFTAPTSGSNGPTQYSEQLIICGPQTTGTYLALFTEFTMRVPAGGTSTLEVVGYRSATTNVVGANYPKIRITPLRYL